MNITHSGLESGGWRLKSNMRKSAGNLMENPDATAAAVFMVMLSEAGAELYPTDVSEDDDLPIDIVEAFVRIEENLGCKICEENENRLNAVHTALETDAPFEDPFVFAATCLALVHGDMADMVSGRLSKPSLPEVMWTIYELNLLSGDGVTNDISPSVSRFINELIGQEAYESETGSPEEVADLVHSFVVERKQQLAQELLNLGVPEDAIQKWVLDEAEVQALV